MDNNEFEKRITRLERSVEKIFVRLQGVNQFDPDPMADAPRDRQILIFGDIGYLVGMCWYSGSYDKTNCFWATNGGHRIIKNPTHWQELPPVPGE